MSQTMMNLIKKYVSNVHEIYGTHLRQVILYGSYARGDYNSDSDVDIMTAKNSHMPCISVTWGFRDEKFLLKSGATILINAPSEIYNHLT